jgi:hypothetical protein
LKAGDVAMCMAFPDRSPPQITSTAVRAYRFQI